jgi:hypothetical protein
MAYQVPINQPLTKTQEELIAKIGSMKNLLSLDFFQQFVIPKGEQISTFDYILKIMRTMGIDPTVLLSSFIQSFLETERLVDFILLGTGQLAAGMKINLDPNSSITFNSNSSSNSPMSPDSSSSNSSKSKKKDVAEINYNYLNNNDIIKTALTSVVRGLELQLVKDLMTLIFGNPKTQSARNTMTELQEEGRMEELIREAYCGNEIFSVSSAANDRNEDLEYNRISLKEKLKNGDLSFQVTCDGVSVSLPSDPEFLFTDALPGLVSSSSITPGQSVLNCIDYVAKQTQKLSVGYSEARGASVQKGFTQIVLEKLITHIVTLLKPFFVGVTFSIPGAGSSFASGYDGIFNEIKNLLISQGRNEEAERFDPNLLYPPSSCEILSNWDSDSSNWTDEQKQQSLIFTIFCNMILNAAIGYLTSLLIKEVKRFIANYAANRAINKLQRRKMKLIQKAGGGRLEFIRKNAKRVTRQATLLKDLGSLINFKSSIFI